MGASSPAIVAADQEKVYHAWTALFMKNQPKKEVAMMLHSRWCGLTLALPMVLAAGCVAFERTQMPAEGLTLGEVRKENRIVQMNEFFTMVPEAVFPARITVLEFGTDPFSRLVSDSYPDMEGEKDPLREGGRLRAVMPITGSALSTGVTNDAMLRHASARAQADLSMVVDFGHRYQVHPSPLFPLNFTLIAIPLVPTHWVRTEVIARGTLIDVRNGLIYGIAEVQLQADDQLVPLLSVDHAVQSQVEALRLPAYRALAQRTGELLRDAQARAGAQR
jgi:hypothetical protein